MTSSYSILSRILLITNQLNTTLTQLLPPLNPVTAPNQYLEDKVHGLLHLPIQKRAFPSPSPDSQPTHRACLQFPIFRSPVYPEPLMDSPHNLHRKESPQTRWSTIQTLLQNLFNIYPPIPVLLYCSPCARICIHHLGLRHLISFLHPLNRCNHSPWKLFVNPGPPHMPHPSI